MGISYGEHLDNYNLQVKYGFSIPGNPNDRIHLSQDLVQQAVFEHVNTTWTTSGKKMRINAKNIRTAAEGLILLAEDCAMHNRVAVAERALEAVRWPNVKSSEQAVS